VFCATLGSWSDGLRMRRDDHPQSNLRPRSIWPARADCPGVLAVHRPMQRWPSKIRSRQRGLQPCHVPGASHPHGPKSQEAGAQRKRQPVRVTDARCPPVDASPIHWSRWQWNWFRVGTPLLVNLSALNLRGCAKRPKGSKNRLFQSRSVVALRGRGHDLVEPNVFQGCPGNACGGWRSCCGAADPDPVAIRTLVPPTEQCSFLLLFAR
jgi:hypothetical protein